jgi:WD40 repeat protein
MSLPAAVTEETRAIRPCHKFEGHTGAVTDVIHVSGGHRMITGSWDGSLRIWDLQSGKQIGNEWWDGEGVVYVIGLSPDGKKVASGSGDGAVRLWDVDTGKVIAKWVGHTRNAYCVCWSRDGGRVVSGALGDGTARVWDVESGKTVLAIETGLKSVWAVNYSPDTTMIATGGHMNEYLKIWDAKTGKLVGKNERVRVANTFLHKASVSDCDIRSMVVGLTHNNLRRNHQRVQTCFVQACDLPPFTNEIDSRRSFWSLGIICSLCTITWYEPFSERTNTSQSNFYRRAPWSFLSSASHPWLEGDEGL